mgnify:FL=1
MGTYVEFMIFDFDGTLVQSGEDISNSVKFTLAALNLPSIDQQEILTFIGDGVVKLIERAIGDAGKTYQEQAMAIFTDHYNRHMLDHAALYPGVYDLLRHFSGKRKIILTNKRYKFTEKMASALNIADFFDEIIGADSTPYIKPDPQLIKTVLERFPVEKKKTIIIGDGVNDILLARNSGIVSCAFLNGLGKRDELLALEPDIVFEQFEELKDRLI